MEIKRDKALVYIKVSQEGLIEIRVPKHIKVLTEMFNKQ
jgi:hypothetical protein